MTRAGALIPSVGAGSGGDWFGSTVKGARTVTPLQERYERGKREHGGRWDPADLDAVEQAIRDAFNHGKRVRVVRRLASDEVWERTGRVSTTTGWKPAFLLMYRSSDMGSGDKLGPKDRIVAVQWDGRHYTPVRA